MENCLYVFITIDTENPQTPLYKGDWNENLFERNDITNGLIADICEQYNFAATYFLNVFEKYVWNNDSVKLTGQELYHRGHDIQLHTHPRWRYEIEKENMWQYSLEEQIEIISSGANLIEDWVKEYPVAHRAGAYGADENTILALNKNDMLIDSSMFYHHTNCKLRYPKHNISLQHDVIEIPVTMMNRITRYKNGPISLKLKEQLIKTDIDWSSLDELIEYVQFSMKSGMKFMNLFLHSYSLLRRDSRSNKLLLDVDIEQVRKFSKFLEYLSSNHNIKVITMKQFANTYINGIEDFKGHNEVPNYESFLGINAVMSRIIRKVKGI